MTSLTTAVGSWSFSTADVASLDALGIFAGIGVSVAQFYTLVLLPALSSLAYAKHKHLEPAQPTMAHGSWLIQYLKNSDSPWVGKRWFSP